MDTKELDLDRLLHSINSHLTVIWGYIQLLQEKHNGVEPDSGWLNKMAQEYQHLNDKLKLLKEKAAEQG